MRKNFFLQIVFLLMIWCTACGKSTEQQIAEQLELGNRYLEELNYEQAIVAFNKAIEIDAKKSEAYAKIAEAYIAMGDDEEARAILEQGYEATGDEWLQNYLEELKKEAAYEAEMEELRSFLTGTGEVYVDLSALKMENILQEEDITFGGVPFYELALEEAAKILSSPESDVLFIDNSCLFSKQLEDGSYCTYATIQSGTTDYVRNVVFEDLHEWGNPVRGLDTCINGIIMGDSCAEVLLAIGFPQKIAEVIAERIEQDDDVVITIDFKNLELDIEMIETDKIDIIYLYIDNCALALLFYEQYLETIQIDCFGI